VDRPALGKSAWPQPSMPTNRIGGWIGEKRLPEFALWPTKVPFALAIN